MEVNFCVGHCRIHTLHNRRLPCCAIPAAWVSRGRQYRDTEVLLYRDILLGQLGELLGAFF